MSLLRLGLDSPKPLVVATVELSGNVALSGSPVARDILVYKNRATTIYTTTTSSASTGNWSVTVEGTTLDKWRVVIIGEVGEFSKIFEDVVGG